MSRFLLHALGRGPRPEGSERGRREKHERQRGIHEDEPDDAIRILPGERIPEHVADVMGHDIRLLNAERVEKPGDVAALRLLALRV